MPLHLSTVDIAIRLLLAFIGGAALGLNREEHGSPAGLRTTVLVCLAAAIAMIQVNLLLDVRGKPLDSFVVMDLMRLPLGILSGMGFIGAGAILRKNTFVRGVTTAATLWFVTVMGLCFGGGQLGLGITSLVIGFIVLWALKHLERRLKWDRQAFLHVELEGDSREDSIRRALKDAGLRVLASGVARDGARRRYTWSVSWREENRGGPPPAVVRELCGDPTLARVEWRPAEIESVQARSDTPS